MDIEDRIFELWDEKVLGSQIAAVIVDEYGMDFDAAMDLVVKVYRERGTPRRQRTKEAIDALSRVHFI